MNDRQLETFLKIADCGSFSKAESLLYCSKQALVKRITALETELGFILFERGHRGIRLTAAGEQFYAGAQKLLQLEKEMLDACRVTAGMETKIRISKIESHMLMDAITLKFAEKYPDIPIEQVMFSGRNECERVSDGLIDLGETPWIPDIEKLNLAYLPLIQLPYLCLMAADHPFAKMPQITINQLHRAEVIVDSRQYSAEHFAFLQANLPNLIVDNNASEQIQKTFALCRQGKILITPAYYARFLHELTAIPLACSWRREYGLVCRRNPSHAVMNYLELAKTHYAALDSVLF